MSDAGRQRGAILFYAIAVALIAFGLIHMNAQVQGVSAPVGANRQTRIYVRAVSCVALGGLAGVCGTILIAGSAAGREKGV